MPPTGTLLGRRGEKHLHVGMRKHHRPLVAALGDHVEAVGHPPLEPLHRVPHRRRVGHRARGLRDPLGADLGRHVTTVDEHPPVGERDADRLREGGEPGVVVERQASLERDEGHGAIHRAGVDVAPAEPRGERPGGRTLAGPGGSVEGDDHVVAPAVAGGTLVRSCSSANATGRGEPMPSPSTNLRETTRPPAAVRIASTVCAVERT